MSTMQEQTISQLLHWLCSDLNHYFKQYEVIRTMGNICTSMGFVFCFFIISHWLNLQVNMLVTPHQ